jgi:hypothetical protein
LYKRIKIETFKQCIIFARSDEENKGKTNIFESLRKHAGLISKKAKLDIQVLNCYHLYDAQQTSTINVLLIIHNLGKKPTTINDVELIDMDPENYYRKIMDTHFRLGKTVSDETSGLRLLVQYSFPGVALDVQEFELGFKIVHDDGEEYRKATSTLFNE